MTSLLHRHLSVSICPIVRLDAESVNSGDVEKTYVLIPIDKKEAELEKKLYCESKRLGFILSKCKVEQERQN